MFYKKTMFRLSFYRNARAGDLLEIFFVSAVSSVLFTRFYLKLAGYPQLGGRSLHIAHMLPGGLLMLAALVITLSFIGYRTQRLASVLGGIGFGLFIDELGKFITRDNNYFFRPTVAILYIIFGLMFISFRRLSHSQELTSTEYLLNALSLSEEAVLHDLDAAERARVLLYLRRADQSNPLVSELIPLFQRIELTSEAGMSRLQRLRAEVESRYCQLIASKTGVKVVDVIVVAKSVWSVSAPGLVIVGAAASSQIPPAVNWLQLLSATVALGLSVAGVVAMHHSRLQAYNLFIKSVLVELFLTQFFDFYRQEFAGLPFFVLNILLYLSLRILVSQERRYLLQQRPVNEEPSSPLPAAATSR